ncbi:MAG: PfkB family carbohydrate kinase [Acidimicrobiia bacterium]
MRPRAILFGEALIDEYPDRRMVAGSPLHVAVHLAALDWETYLVSRLGSDNDGEWILETLSEHGVADDMVEMDDELPTGTVEVVFAEDGSHDFTICGPAAWDAIVGPESLPDHDVFVFSGLAARDARSAGALWRLLGLSDARVKVFDVTMRPPDVVSAVIARGLAESTLLKVNDEEASAVADIVGTADPMAWMTANPSLSWVCVTHGEDGADLYSAGGDHASVSGVSVKIVDTVGAGDTFNAGLIDALARGEDSERALVKAQTLAATTVNQRGGLPKSDR